jgi:hypothetical protein
VTKPDAMAARKKARKKTETDDLQHWQNEDERGPGSSYAGVSSRF